MYVLCLCLYTLDMYIYIYYIYPLYTYVYYTFPGDKVVLIYIHPPATASYNTVQTFLFPSNLEERGRGPGRWISATNRYIYFE